MAALEEDEVNPFAAGSLASGSPDAYESEGQSALDGGEDYGGAGEDVPISPNAASVLSAQLRNMKQPAGSNREMLRQMVLERLAQRQAQAPQYGTFDASARDFDPNVELQLDVPPQEKPKEEAGWGQIFSRGIQRANEAIAQDKDLAEGKAPRASKTPAAEFEQPLELGDFTTPVTAAKKLWYGLAKSYPAVAASVAGSVAGGAAGTAVGGPLGGTIGGVVGGAAGMGGGSFLMEIGPAYQAEREVFGEGITPEQDQEAWNKAWDKSLIAGGVGIASMGFFGVGKPFSNALKNILTPAVEGAAKPVAGIPLRAAVQTVGQPAISVGGQVTENVVEGKPLGTNLNQAVAGGLANVVPDVAAALGGRAVRRVLGGRQGEVTPGVTDEQKLALEQYGPELPPRPYPERQDYGPDLPPRPYPERQDYGPDLPPRPYPERQDYGPDLPPRPYPERGTPSEFSVGQPPEEPPPPPPPPPPSGGGGGGPMPPPRPFTPEARPVETAPTRPADFGVGAPEERPPMPPPPVTTPEEFGISRPPGAEEPPPPPPGGGGPPPLPRPQPFPPTERPIGQRPTRPEDFTIERDHLDPSRSVAKDVNGEVVGKGATPEQATQDAALRQGAPYRDEGVGFTTERGSTYEIHDDGTTTRNKSYHPEHGAEDVGPKPRSARTIYVDSQADAANLSGAGVSGAFGHRLVLNPDGTATLAWKARPDAKWGTHANNRDIPFTTEPAVGKHPVEMWGPAKDVPGAAEAYSGQHAGNRIVEMRGRTEEVPAEQAKSAATGTSEQLVSERAPPAEAAKPEPAASGRDAASETPSGETRAPRDLHQMRLEAEQRKARTMPELAERLKELGVPNPTITRMRKAEREAKIASLEAAAEVKAKGEARNAAPKAGAVADEIIEARKTEAATLVKRVTEKAKARAEERVTKPTESGAQKPAPNEDQGTRTKSGAYVSPGEAAEAQAPHPARQRTEMQQEARAESAGHTRQSSHILAREAAPEPAEPFHVPDNLNTVRKAQRIIQHILNGMKIADAVKAFGAKAEGTVGRPRNVESLSSFIREELKTADTGAATRDLEMAKAAAKLRKLGPEPIPGEMSDERRAISDELIRRLKLTKDVRANRAKLEDVLRQVEAIERGEPVPTREVQDVPRSPMAQIVEYMALRPEVNEPVLRATEGRRGSKFSSILDAIENNRVIQRLIPQYSELARVLRRILPDVDVVKSDDISYAGYNPNTGKIEVNAAGLREVGDRLGATTAMLHEGIHVATDSYVTHLYRTPEELLTPRELAHKTALEATRAEIDRIREGASEYDRDVLELTQRLYEGGAPHELATYILTQPEVMGILAGTKASVEFKTALSNVGLGLSRNASIWDGFKRIVRSILGLSERSDSVLDHVLRPLTEIVETGARYRREEVLRARREVQVRNNEVLGGSAQTRDVTSMRRLRETAARTAKDIADRGIIKTAMRGAFQSATTTAIRDFIRNDVPSAVSHFEYLRQITHASEQERVRPVTTHGPNGEERTEPNIDKARRLHQELKTGPDAPETNKLMTEVTQAGMSVIDPRRNAHLTTDAQLRQQEAFQARFDALDPRAKQTYREVNEYHNEIYRAEREAKVKNLVDIAFGDRSEADKQAIREQMRTKEGVLDVLNSPDATPVSKVLGRDWENKKDLVRLIAESQEGGFVDGDYFPSRRHGEYVVSAGEHNKPGYLVQMFETQSSAQVFRDQLIQSGRTDVSQVFVKSRSRPRDLVSVAALSTLDKAMERAGLSGDAAEVMRDMYAGIMIQHGTRLAERTMRREGIAGASVDQARNILGDFLAYTSRIGHLMHGADAARTLYGAEKEARALHQAGSGASEQRVANAQLGVEELRNRMSPGDGDRSADWMGTGTRALTTLTVLNTLLRPAHFFMQLAGTHAASTSLIAARHGYLGSVGAVNRAYAQLAGTAGGAFKTNAMAALRQELRAANWDLADMYRRRLSRANSGIAPDHADLLIDRLNQAGLINHTWIREIQRLAGPQGFGDGKFNFVSRFLDVSSAGEHAIDSMMRVGTAKAAFELEYHKNGGHLNDALDYAMQMAERSQPDYTMHNKARIATVQGSLGRLAPLTTQFRQFGLHMYGVQGNLLAEGVRGAKGSAERAEAFKSIAYLQASHALIWSGVGTAVFGSLPMMAVLGLFDLLNPNDPTNRAHTNREMETASRNWVRDKTGSKTAADIFAHGIPMAFGLNVSRSLQFTNMLSPPELNSFNKPDVLSFLAQAMTGASSDTAAGLVEGISRFWGGDTSKEAIAKMLPRIARDPLEAIVWGEQGLKTHKGDLTIVPPEKFSTFDLLAKGAGFIPEVSSTARDARAAINLRELTHRDITGAIIDRLVKAAPDEKKAAMAEITRYNASVDPADRITGQQIQSRLREQARINAMPEHFGMRLPRREYGKIAEITAFSR